MSVYVKASTGEERKVFSKYSNKELSEKIDEWIRGEVRRGILKRRIIDCKRYSEIAEEFGVSERTVCNIVYVEEKNLLDKLL